MKFKSLLDFTNYFKDEKTCFEYFETLRFGNNNEPVLSIFKGFLCNTKRITYNELVYG